MYGKKKIDAPLNTRNQPSARDSRTKSPLIGTNEEFKVIQRVNSIKLPSKQMGNFMNKNNNLNTVLDRDINKLSVIEENIFKTEDISNAR